MRTFVRLPCGLMLRGCLLWMLSGAALGATLSSESSVGVSSEYASNPFLLPSGARSAESLALVVNLPATYTSDTQTLELIPRLRVGQSYGSVALLSDYEDLDGDWHWKSERNTFVVSAGWHHDSTYYNQFEQVALLGHDLRRVEAEATASWDRSLTERSDVQLSGSYDRMAYSQEAASAVSNFSYSQASGQFNRQLSERWQWTTSVGYGQFKLLNGGYLSDQRFAQTGLSRTLSERWSMLAQIGYAYLTAHGISYTCCELAVSPAGSLYFAPIPVEQYASRSSPNYLVTAQRQGERWMLNFTASRAIEPSGFGALLTEDNAGVSASLSSTERLTLGGGLQWSRLSDSLGRLNLEDLHFYTADLTAGWLWTEHWTLQLQATYTQQYVAPQLPAIPGVTVYLNLLRQFGRLRL